MHRKTSSCTPEDHEIWLFALTTGRRESKCFDGWLPLTPSKLRLRLLTQPEEWQFKCYFHRERL